METLPLLWTNRKSWCGHTISKLRNAREVDVPNSVSNLKWTPIFEWFMVGCESKKNNNKTCVEKEIGPQTQNLCPILDAIINITGKGGELYDHLMTLMVGDDLKLPGDGRGIPKSQGRGWRFESRLWNLLSTWRKTCQVVNCLLCLALACGPSVSK